jgi:hypothetical protein
MNKNDTNDLKDVIVLANDEIVVESFAGFEIVEPAGKGYFTITNKRLIYHATYRGKLSSSIAVRECALENVGVISSEFGRRTHKLQRTIGLIILLLGLGLLGYGIGALYAEVLKLGPYARIVGGVLAVLGLIVALTAKRKMFSLDIFTRTPQTNFLSFTSDFFQSPNRGRIRIKPTRETHQLIKELGKHVLEARSKY